MRHGIFHLVTGTALAIALSASSAYAQKKYDTGATDTEIKLGQTMPYSGPASAYGTIGKAELAYFKMINEQGGINGRKINLIQYDDAYSPPKTVEQVRKLVESDEVLLTFQIIGTAARVSNERRRLGLNFMISPSMSSTHYRPGTRAANRTKTQHIQRCRRCRRRPPTMRMNPATPPGITYMNTIRKVP